VVERTRLRLHQMQKLIVDLLDMTKIEAGTKVRELCLLDLREAAEKSMELLEPQAQKRSVTLELKAPAALAFCADRGEVDMILNNLISNAIKYNREGGRVEISLEGDGHGAALTVSDTGIGMNADEQAKLFGEFVRIKNDRTRNILGSGLGLSIVKKLAELYHGEVRVESSAGAGSKFTVTLKSAAKPAEGGE
jgi:two-component system, sensor histidine kinase and response regulator